MTSCKCVLLLSVVGLASMVWGAATSDFAGVWMTRAGTDVWTVELAGGHRGRMSVRGCVFPLSWSEGNGSDVCLKWSHADGKEGRLVFAYDEESGTINLGRHPEKKTALGFSGRFHKVADGDSAKGEGGSPYLLFCAESLASAIPESKASRDKVVERSLETFETKGLLENDELLMTVDARYPRVAMMPDPWNPKALRMYYIYGRKEPGGEKKDRLRIVSFPKEVIGEDGTEGAFASAVDVWDEGEAMVVPIELARVGEAGVEAGVMLLFAEGDEELPGRLLQKLLGAERAETRKTVVMPSSSCVEYSQAREHAAGELKAARATFDEMVKHGGMKKRKVRPPSARSRDEAERIMRENDYEGEWVEEHVGETAKFILAKDHTGEYLYRGKSTAIRWSSDGSGRIKVMGEQGGESYEMPSVTYDPETDTLDLGFEGRKTGLGFKGILAFKSRQVSVKKAVRNDFSEEWVDATDRNARFDKMIRENDPSLVRLDSPQDFPTVEEILKKDLIVEIVDKDYPHFEVGGALNRISYLDMHIAFARYDSKGVSDANRTWRIYWKPSGTVLRNSTAGISDDEVTRFEQKMSESEIPCSRMKREYGKGSSYWYEDVVSLTFLPEDRKLAQETLGELLKTLKYPRYCTIRKCDYWEKMKKKEEMMKQKKGKKERGLFPCDKKSEDT